MRLRAGTDPKASLVKRVRWKSDGLPRRQGASGNGCPGEIRGEVVAEGLMEPLYICGALCVFHFLRH